MFGKHETDVLVVGAGPVGLLAALALTRQGVRVEIVDEQWRPAQHSYAAALHPASLRLLDHFGLLSELRAHGCRVTQAVFYDGAARRAALRFLDLSVEFPFVLVVRQSTLESLLEEQLRKLGVKVLWNHRVAQLQPERDRVVATLEKLGKVTSGYAISTAEWVLEKTLHTSACFVIGADGHHSVVRRALGIELEPAGETEDFAVFEFRCDGGPGEEVRVVLDDRTTNVLWPLPDGFCRWSFQIADAQVPEESRAKSRLAVQIGERAFPHVSPESLHTLIGQRAPWFEAGIGETIWSLAVRFERRLAQRFGRDRLWLAGDAAHLAGPVGAQSMNVGLREADELASAVAQILKEGGALDRLEAYNTERSVEWPRLLGRAGGLVSTPQTDPWITQRCGRILPCIPASGDDLSQLVRQWGLTWS